VCVLVDIAKNISLLSLSLYLLSHTIDREKDLLSLN